MKKVKKSLTLLAIFMLPFVAVAQQEVSWKLLTNITFSKKYVKKYDSYFKLPVFTKEIKALEGKEIIIKGYIIPVDTKTNYIVLSANPYTNCFFCGNAGPETVMEIKSKKELPILKMDEVVTFKGRLKLNDEDIYELNYVLENAEVVNK